MWLSEQHGSSCGPLGAKSLLRRKEMAALVRQHVNTSALLLLLLVIAHTETFLVKLYWVCET